MIPSAPASPTARLLVATVLAGVAALAFWLVRQPSLRYYVYNVPIAVPFVLFLEERWRLHRATHSTRRRALDLAVLALSLTRAFYPVPYVSGHVLFLGYATFTAQTALSRAAAALVLTQVLFMKLALFHEYGTPSGALALVTLATFAWGTSAKAEGNA